MNKVVYRMFWDYEKEEQWLNDMAGRGWALIRYFWARYEFEPCAPGAYIYRIELLTDEKSAPQKEAYLNFLAEAGVTHIASYMDWIYLRKKSADGPFALYTDLESRIMHYRRVKTLWMTAIGAETLLTLINAFLGFQSLTGEHRLSGWLNIGAAVLLLISVLYLYRYVRRLNRKIDELESEKVVRE